MLTYKQKLATYAYLNRQRQNQKAAQQSQYETAIIRADELRALINIVDLVGQDTTLKSYGHGEYRGHCPLHDDHEPSFFVNENKQVFHCFSCGGGDVVQYIRKRDDVNFYQALATLEDFIAGEYVPSVKPVTPTEPDNTPAPPPPAWMGDGAYGQYAPKLIEGGYWTVPICPNEKRPYGPAWNKHTAPLDPTKYSACDVGILCGVGEHPVYGIDIDVYDQKVTHGTVMYINKLLNTPNVFMRVGKKPKALIPVRMAKPNLPKRLSAKFDCGNIEILGKGQQFKAIGIHPDTNKPYTWLSLQENTSFLNTKAQDLPLVTEEQLDKILDKFEDICKNLTIVTNSQ